MNLAEIITVDGLLWPPLGVDHSAAMGASSASANGWGHKSSRLAKAIHAWRAKYADLSGFQGLTDNAATRVCRGNGPALRRKGRPAATPNLDVGRPSYSPKEFRPLGAPQQECLRWIFPDFFTGYRNARPFACAARQASRNRGRLTKSSAPGPSPTSGVRMTASHDGLGTTGASHTPMTWTCGLRWRWRAWSTGRTVWQSLAFQCHGTVTTSSLYCKNERRVARKSGDLPTISRMAV